MINSMTIDIIRFFLNIFKLQSNLAGNPGQFSPINSDKDEKESIVELRVRKGDQWITRRMTISPLGEESGSKSKCFMVIYDDLIVIKVPPTPLTDFDRYMESIEAERVIGQRIMPDIQCVTPSISAILRKIPPFSSETKTDPVALERQCIQKLKIFPNFQDYLKIGKSFAFFMALSKYSFLGDVIADMHDISEAAGKEILSQADILGDPMAFEDLYGKCHAGTFFSLDNIYADYDEQLEAVVRRQGVSPIPVYQKKEWFLIHLAEKRMLESDDTPFQEIIGDVNRILEQTIKDHIELVKRYRSAIRSHIYRRTFKQNRIGMAGIIVNLLDLLAKLRIKGVAMRDLKPDNVFLVADLSGTPITLSNPEEFSIGLIDFETAVVFRPDTGESLRQPMLAGTPSYATPSHLFANEILAQIYPDVGRTLHFQDWQAVNSMIYNVVTGQRLTQETGRLMPGIVKGIKTSLRKKLPKKDLFEKYSRVFWQNMFNEIKKKTHRNQTMLESVMVNPTQASRIMLITEIDGVRKEIAARVHDMIQSQQIFKSDKSREGLEAIAPETLERCKTNWERGTEVPHMPSAVRKQVIQFLGGLSRLKRESEELYDFRKSLEQPSATVSVHQLILTLFRIIFYYMFRSEWGDIEEKPLPSAPREKLDTTATATYEETVELERTITQIFDG